MSYGIKTVFVAKNVRLDKRKSSPSWYARLKLDGKKNPEVKSTKTDDLEEAKERALQMYYDAKARVANGLPASTRTFKHVAEYTIERMQDALDAGAGKQAYKDYISALREWLIPFFGKRHVSMIDLASLKEFDEWRTAKHGRGFSKSGINNHNAALNRVFDDAVMHKWMSHNMRPDLLNKGVPSESRGSFTDSEYTTIYTALRTWHEETNNEKAEYTREVLRNYVLVLANTGIRTGTEALGLRWRHVDWYVDGSDKYLRIFVDGKTKGRSVICRDPVEKYLDRQRQLHPNLSHNSLDDLIAAKSDEFVFTTRLGKVATVFNLNRAFNALLDDLGLKHGTDEKPRSLYSLRHYYATRELQRGITTHTLARHLGTSTAMIDKHYSKYSSMMNANMHSGRDMKRNIEVVAKPQADYVELAFQMCADGQLDAQGLLATLGVSQDNYNPTDEVRKLALVAKGQLHIDDKTLMEILTSKAA